MNRSEARCEAFKLAFQITAHKDSYPQVVELFEEENCALKKSDKKQFVYIVSTANGIFEKKDTLDDVIAKHLKAGWRTDRLSKVSLAILRLAVYEILFIDDIPDSVSVNEAVELAKAYDIDEAPSFINGVLSNILASKA